MGRCPTPASVYDAVVDKLRANGVAARWYEIRGGRWYASVQGAGPVMRCLEARLGTSAVKADYDCYAIAQSFLPDFPSIAATFVVDVGVGRHDVHAEPARFSREIDRVYSRIFLPIMFGGLGPLDPSGCGHSLLVQSYNSILTVPDFLAGSLYTARLVREFRAAGQLGLIAADYHDPLSSVIAGLLHWATAASPRIHMLRRSAGPSQIRVPILSPTGEVTSAGGHSLALDRAIAKAKEMMSSHTGAQVC
jgi:hypothetical protein